ncbi:MAG TPA: outer membrane lipid asymmetry maintenance protein MlaD [Alphaproteobacteria bacterium]|nr:outer membrane lipid asymmetry maintenance protein MlaD [Alphaproteobacteria bacterium]
MAAVVNAPPPRAASPEQSAARKALSRQNTEILVGTLVLIVFALFIIYAFAGTGIAAKEGYPVTAQFGQVDGLAVGSQVTIAGLPVGQVTKLDLDPKEMRPIVTMTIDRSIKLPTDSSARVATDGLLGPKFIKIDPGGDEETIPPGGHIEYVQDAVIVERLLQKIVNDAEARHEARERGAKGGAGDKKNGAGDKTGAGDKNGAGDKGGTGDK